MKNRPWPIVLLALFRILSPISSLFLNAWFIQMNPMKYLYRFITMGSMFNLFDFFILPVISGVAVFAMKPWSYPIFLSISAWTLYSNASFVIQVRETPGIWWVMSLFLLDFMFVSYFLLLPTVRKVYFDSRLRWWEQKPRYLVELDGAVQTDPLSKPKHCSILDISEGGILIKTKDQFVMHEPVQLSFTCFHLAVRMKAVAVHEERSMGRYGFRFIDVPKTDQTHLKRLIKALAMLQAPLRNPARMKLEEFLAWAKQLITQGKGWKPELGGGNRGAISNGNGTKTKDTPTTTPKHAPGTKIAATGSVGSPVARKPARKTAKAGSKTGSKRSVA